MVNRSNLRLRVVIRQNKTIYLLVALTICMLLAYRVPYPLKQHALTARDSARSMYANHGLSLPNQKISGLYTLWRKVTAMDTVLEKVEKPFEPIGKSNYRTKAMQNNADVERRMAQLTDRYICLADFKSFGNLFYSDKARFWLIDQEPVKIDVGKNVNYQWIFNKRVKLSVGKNIDWFQNIKAGEIELNLDHFPNDTLVTFKIPIATSGEDILIDSEDRNVYATLGLNPIRIKDCMSGSKILPSASMYNFNSTDSAYATVVDSAGIDFDYPIRQFIVPGNKRYTALIVHYDNLQTTSSITCANMDSIGRFPGLHHPQLPIMVAAIGHRQSLLVNALSMVPHDAVRLTFVAATSNRYDDLKAMYVWFIKNEMRKVRNRGVPLSEAYIKIASEWINQQFAFKLNRRDSSDLARSYQFATDELNDQQHDDQ